MAATVVAARQEAPADTLYRAGRRALNRGEYRRAADLLRRLLAREPEAKVAAEALYYRALALYNEGGMSNLRGALASLERQREGYPDAATRGDAAALAARIRGALARRGDPAAAAVVAAEARIAAEVADVTREMSRTQREVARVQTERAVIAGARQTQQSRETDVQAAALSALMQMDSERAIPVLKKVVARRDPGSEELRRQAMFILAQYDDEETADIMLEAVRSDPDPEVREQAVFWLSQVDSPKALEALEVILRNPADSALHEAAVFALSQRSGARAGALLEELAANPAASGDVRQTAIFWLSQRPSAQTAAFLRDLYGTARDPATREQILFALSQMSGQGSGEWLLGVALDESEDIQIRQQALFAAQQSGDVAVDRLVGLYDRSPDREMKEQLLFVFSQSDDRAAVDKMIDIARNETDEKLREAAVFWLGQSGDPRAEQVLIEILSE